MARKKTSRTDKADASQSAGEGMTPPEAGAQDMPETETAPLPEDASTPESVEAPDDTSETGAPPDDVPQDTPEAEAKQDASGDTTDLEADPAPDAETETPPEGPEEPAAAATEPESEPTADTTPMVRTEQVTVRQGGFWSMLVGGIAAAGIGVAAAPYIHPYFPKPEPDTASDPAIAARLDAQAQRLDDLGARLDALPAPADPGDAVAGLSETVTDLTERVAKLEADTATLADRPAPTAPDTASALDDLRARLAAQGDEIAALRDAIDAEEQAARDSARATLQRAALTRVMTALDTGDTFSAALADLRETGAPVPDALAQAAQTGVPTRAQLVESFPEAARAALAAARGTGTGPSVGGFLRAQLGVRSLEPREGDDTDAILSRAEAALAGGRLGDALAEIETLPEAARAATSDWAARATARHDALAAAEELSAQLN
ncbi:hypothetical protein ABIE58_002437 [Roseovarius sp. MBR-78]|uniref:COG4223 family protein n=1 Tax=Roseovarius sp. MBR-78 TaxID=3156460 RepID=UPI003399A38D